MIENFGKNVARLRKERDMTQIELAQAIGVNKQTISNIEKGKGYPSFNNLEKISQVLKATPIELFGTLKEIALQDTPGIMDRIDRYSDKIQEIFQAEAFLEAMMYDEEVKKTVEMVAMLYHMFQQPIMRDEF
ncbi:MAG: helix-turn-helix transcriptional regulator [Ruminococcus sp.]|nr:helix-turn-helix transcriptional regulator [Ruminococcus sp.]